MAEYYYYIPVGSIIFFICMLAFCCRRACDNKRSRPPPQGQVYVIPGSGVQNTQATSNVWHTGDQARVAQSGYYSGQEFPSTGYQKDDYQPPTGYPDNTQPYPAHNMTQGAAYSDPQTGFGYSSPTGGYTSPTSPPCDPVLPPYTPPSAPDTGTTQPGGQKDPLGAPPPYDQAVSLNNGPK